jgi:hypothetical protein
MTDKVEKAQREEEREREKRDKAAHGDKGVGQVGEAFNLVKEYARQETLGPLRGAGRWLAFGIMGSLLFGLASFLVVLGVLRVLQNDTGDTFRGRWMGLLPYVIAIAVAGAIVGIAVSRIGKRTLNND